jgi:hypothetical protein
MKDVLKDRFIVNYIIIVWGVFMLATASYFFVERIYRDLILSDFQKISLHIFSLMSFIYVLLPVIFIKEKGEWNMLKKSLEISKQKQIEKKLMILICVTIFASVWISGFIRNMFYDISWTFYIQKRMTNLFVTLGIYALFGFPVFLVIYKRTLHKLMR